MTHEQFNDIEIQAIRGYYSRNAVKITMGVSRQGRGIHVAIGNVKISYDKERFQFEWQLRVGTLVIAAGNHPLLEAVLYDSQQSVKQLKKAALTLEVTQ